MYISRTSWIWSLSRAAIMVMLHWKWPGCEPSALSADELPCLFFSALRCVSTSLFTCSSPNLNVHSSFPYKADSVHCCPLYSDEHSPWFSYIEIQKKTEYISSVTGQSSSSTLPAKASSATLLSLSTRTVNATLSCCVPLALTQKCSPACNVHMQSWAHASIHEWWRWKHSCVFSHSLLALIPIF